MSGFPGSSLHNIHQHSTFPPQSKLQIENNFRGISPVLPAPAGELPPLTPAFFEKNKRGTDGPPLGTVKKVQGHFFDWGFALRSALVAAKSALLWFRLTAKPPPAPLHLLSPRKPLCWVCVGAPYATFAAAATLTPREVFFARYTPRQKMISLGSPPVGGELCEAFLTR